MRRRLTAALACLALGLARGDTIHTVTDDVIHGTIQRIRGGKVVIDTAFAGTLRIPRDQIKKLEYATDKPLYARLDPESKAKEEVRLSADAEGNPVLIPVADKAKALALGEVATLWPTDGTDPDFPPIKRWAFSLSTGITGNAGNTKDFSISLYADAVRSTESTTLKLYGSLNKTRSDHTLTAEQYIGGLDFEHRPTNVISWYLRDEAQHNRFSDYWLRNVAAAGYGHYLINASAHGRATKLRLRLGLSHALTVHYTKSHPGSQNRWRESDLAVDLGLLFHHDFEGGLGWNTEITFNPLIDDLSEGTLVHETRLTYTLRELRRFSRRLSDIALEMGMRNEFKTDPDPGYCNTDTSWYVRLSKTW